MADADVCLVMADKAQQAYTHPDFMRARRLGKALVVLLTVASAMDRVALLDLGADDCMVRPLEQRELAGSVACLASQAAEQVSIATQLGPFRPMGVGHGATPAFESADQSRYPVASSVPLVADLSESTLPKSSHATA